VFRLSSGKNLSLGGLNRILKSLTKNRGLTSLKLSAKSFRAGLPTDLSRKPDLFGENTIKSLGRWSSSAYRVYEKDGRAKKRWELKKLSDYLANQNSVQARRR